MTVTDFSKYAVPGSRAHLIGIGGVSMSPLAEVLLGMGLCVSGSDINESAAVKHLRSLGIDVRLGHAAENVAGADLVVRTAAVHDGKPEIRAARAAGIPVFERTQAWGAMMRDYKNALCIAGTHGKTTTTSMATHIFTEARRDPTVMIGGTLPLLHSGYRVGGGDTIILESCEYYDSFLSFYPTVAVILNIDADHLDYFKDLDAIKASFRAFAALTPEDGCIIANADDANTLDALAPLGRKYLTFGFGENADVRAVNIEQHGFGSAFDLIYRGETEGRVELRVPGRHNIVDALAASAAALALAVPADAVIKGLAGFTGAGRRFEYKGDCGGARVYDDYAHHPRELRALLEAARSVAEGRVICAFQPHTYSRTKALLDDFAEELKKADKVFLAEIYAAREDNDVGVYSADLAAQIPGAVCCADFGGLERALRAEARPGDVILTVGAGDIFKVGDALTKG